MKTITRMHSHKQPVTPWNECRQWQDAQNTPSNKMNAPHSERRRIKKYHETRWGRLNKMTAPNSLIILIKHHVLAVGALAGTLALISLLLPSLFENRYLIAGGLAVVAAFLPSLLKVVTAFFFNKSWSYRRCLTPFVMMACLFSALPGLLLIQKGPPSELVIMLETQQLEVNDLGPAPTPLNLATIL